MEYVTITHPGNTTFKVGEVISREAFEKENERVTMLGETPASGRFSLPTPMPPEERRNPMTAEEIEQVANKVAAKVLDEITPTILDPAGRGTLLHFTEHEIEGAGLVVNEARARATPCSCFTYKGREYCFSKGVLGMMSSAENPEQIEEYCKVGKTYEVNPGIKERFETFAGAAEEAHKKIEGIPKGERLVPWFQAMGKELEKRGIEV